MRLAIAAALVGLTVTPRAVEDSRRASDPFAGAVLPDATVKTARLPTGAVVAVADRAPTPDRSWAASLLVADGAHAPLALCDRVFHASRPLPLPTGEVAVERGRAGPSLPGRIRLDELTIDAVDPGPGPATGAARTLYSAVGFEAHLAAVAGHELIVYLIQPDVASLRAIDWSTGGERVIVPSLPGWAHDFSVEDGALVVHNRDDVRPELQTLERIDLANGNRTRLATYE